MSSQIKQKDIDKIIKFYQLKEYKKAIKEGKKLLLIDKNNITILIYLASCSQFLKNKEDEKKYLLALTELNHTSPAIYNDLANIYTTEERYEEAYLMFYKALSVDANYLLSYNGLGILAYKEKNYEEAIEMYQKALSIDESIAQVYNNLGNVYKKKEEYSKAKEMYEKSQHLGAGNTSVYSNLARLLELQKEYKQSKLMFEKCISMGSDDIDMHFEYGLLLLKMYEYKKGFDFYRYRYHQYKKVNNIVFSSLKGLLEKKDKLENKTLLITQEQGYGDFIHFMRFIPSFVSLCKEVVVYVEVGLAELFSQVFPKLRMITYTELDTLHYDYRMPLFDAAYILDLEYASIPYKNGYIEPKNFQFEKPFTKKSMKKKLAFNYQGSKLHKKDADRSTSLALMLKYLSPLVEDGFELYSIQYEASGHDKKLLKHNNIIDLGSKIENFSTTASILSEMDFIVSVDTALVHLGGAMGIKTLVLLAFHADWRWGIDGAKTNWYESVTLFRQKNKGEWDSVFEELRSDLQTLSVEKSSMQKAIAFHEEGNLEEAEKMYKQAIREEPKNADAYHYLGVIAFDSGYTREAIALIGEAIKLNPSLDEAYENLEAIAQTL